MKQTLLNLERAIIKFGDRVKERVQRLKHKLNQFVAERL